MTISIVAFEVELDLGSRGTIMNATGDLSHPLQEIKRISSPFSPVKTQMTTFKVVDQALILLKTTTSSYLVMFTWIPDWCICDLLRRRNCFVLYDPWSY